ncbi:MAG: 4-alpha-glucanotransferase [Candidatus Binataceae bacterium]|nr:4-alpha-glucanotransferase [Candidatus Binataceae bacterium]
MLRRSAGILIPLFSLRTRHDLGRGDIGGLGPMLDWALAMGHRLIQLLPLNETTPGEASPYSPLSIFAIDPLYIAVEQIEGIPDAALKQAYAEIGGRRKVAREVVRSKKLDLLGQAFRWFLTAGGGEERAAFSKFQKANEYWLPAYALFRALKDRFNWKPWDEWPYALRNLDRCAIGQARAELADSIARYSYWQFLAHRQICAARANYHAAGAMIGGDLAFSPGRDSAEVWSRQDHFDFSRLVGAPPDAFSANGQRWGLPMPRWDRMGAEGWPLVRSRMRQARDLYDVVRIDHVVGLYRTYNFAADSDDLGNFTPAEVTAQRQQGESIMRAIQAEAPDTDLIAEDLGLIPDWVHDSLQNLKVPGYKVLRWEKAGRGNPEDRYVDPACYSELSVASTGTHDTETLAQWWRECGAQQRRLLVESVGIETREVWDRDSLDELTLDALLEALYAAPSVVVIEPLQDLFGWTARINYPGTVRASNWSWRLPAAIEHLKSSPVIARRAATLAGIAKRTGRF